jgi:hypothetical protein
MRGALLLLVLALAAGCSRRQTNPDSPPAAANSQAASRTPGPTGPVKDWTALLARVKDAAGRQAQALSLLAEAKEEYTKARTLEGDAFRSAMKKAKAAYEQAGGIFDMLQMEVEKVDKDLWTRRFADFQAKWDRLASPEMKRALLSFR